MSKPLLPKKMLAELEALPGWAFKREALEKTFTFGSFREAMSFMGRVAFEAEELNHHPDWKNSYNRVSIRLSTHVAGSKVTKLDVELARRVETISWGGVGPSRLRALALRGEFSAPLTTVADSASYLASVASYTAIFSKYTATRLTLGNAIQAAPPFD